MRNAETSKSLRQRYHELTGDPVPLPMFCISNSEYTIHAIGYNKKEPPKMSVEVTEIPALRSFLYGLPAVRKFRAFDHHRKVVLPSLLNNLEMTCSQTKLMRRDEIQKILLSAPTPICKDIQNIFDKFFDESIVPGIAIIKTNKISYAEHATAQLAKWKKWSNPTHKAFCIHRGCWSTKKVGNHDWNKDMLEPLLKAVEKDIRRWDDTSNALLTTVSDKLSAMIMELISQLEGMRCLPQPFVSYPSLLIMTRCRWIL